MSEKKRKFRMKHPKDEQDLNRVIAEVSAQEAHIEHHEHHRYSMDELLTAMATSLHVLEHEIEDIKVRIRVIEAKIDQIFDMIASIQKRIEK